MKVVYITNSIGSKANGGSSLSGLRFMQLLESRFGSIELVTDEWKSPPKSESGREVHLLSISHGNLTFSFRGVAKFIVFSLINIFRSKVVHIDCAGDDVLMFVNSFTDLVQRVRLVNCNRMLKICVVRGDVTSFRYQPWGKDDGIKKAKEFLESFSAIIYVSKTIQANWIAAGVKVKSYYLPNAINEDEILAISNRPVSVLKKELNLDPKRFHVVVVGSLQQRKGQDLFVEIAERLVSSIPDIQVHFIGGISAIFGGGEIKNRLARLGPNFVIHGHRDNVIEYVHVADVAVSTSRSEAFPRTVAEYMAMGKAIISTRVAGADEMIDSKVNGFLVDVDDVTAIFQNLVYLYNNREKLIEFGGLAREKYFSQYSTFSQQAGFDRLIDDILSE